MGTTTTVRVSGTQGTTITLDLYVFDCANCGVIFALNKDYDNRRREDGKSFVCPNGHVQSYDAAQERREKKLRADLAEATAKANRLESSLTYTRQDLDQRCAEVKHVTAQLAGTKGALTRAKKRAVAGVCPCCNRSFQQVAKHIRSQHPREAAALLEHPPVPAPETVAGAKLTELKEQVQPAS